ncbi:aldo/keto reductase [Solirubrobacter soli]|uniref:aldo/keto reductase n=1 Tax=Solirubrobacter soli TaxID=363832 RepID=UPI00040DD697|nr:aldo/keto reductase [Solirubrobacter soli]
MRYRTFGRLTGLRVSEYALGAGNFGTSWGVGAEPAEARRMFDRFAEAGGTLIDTAETYQFGESETLLGDFLAADRDQFVVATKYSVGNDRRGMVRAVEGSLERLKTDRIDLYWVHHQDGVTPIEEVLRGLDDLVSSGKILHAGLSNFPAWRVARAQTIAELRGSSPVAGIQVEFSLVERSADRELIPMAEALGLGVALWSPLGGGLLTGKYRSSDAGRLTDWNRLIHTEDSEQKTRTVDEVLAIAAELDVPPAQVAMAWLRDRDARSATSLVSIIGPRTVEQLDDYLAALDVTLTREQAARLDAVSAPALGVPHGVAAEVRERFVGADFDVSPVPVA